MILTVASGVDEDFNWDMDDEDETTPPSGTPLTALSLPSDTKANLNPPAVVSDVATPDSFAIDNDATPRKSSSATTPAPLTPIASHTPSLSYANSPRTPLSTDTHSMAAFSNVSTSTSGDESHMTTSSEGAGSSFDVVGARSGDPSEIDESVTDALSARAGKQGDEVGSGEDSDWE